MNLPVSPSSNVTARNTVKAPSDYCDRDNMNAFLFAISHGSDFHAACTYANVLPEAVLEQFDIGLTTLNTEEAQFVDLFRAAMRHARSRVWASWRFADRRKAMYLKASLPPEATPADHKQFVVRLAHEAYLF